MIMITMATTVSGPIGIPNMNHERTAVTTTSRAVAKFLTIEFNDFRKTAVVIPMAARLHITTLIFMRYHTGTPSSIKQNNSSNELPDADNMTKPEMIESVYKKIFCTHKFRSLLCRFTRNSV